MRLTERVGKRQLARHGIRLFGPTEAAFNKSWKPGDIEKVK